MLHSGAKCFEILFCPTDPISVFLFSGQWNKICFVRHLITEEEISSQIITLIKKLIKNMFLKSTHAKLDAESIRYLLQNLLQNFVINLDINYFKIVVSLLIKK